MLDEYNKVGIMYTEGVALAEKWKYAMPSPI